MEEGVTMKNKIITLVLILAIVMGSLQGAFAIGSETDILSGEKTFGTPILTLKDDTNISLSFVSGETVNRNDRKILNEEEYFAVHGLENIYISESGQYLMKTPMNENSIAVSSKIQTNNTAELLVPIKRIDIELSDTGSVAGFVMRDDIPQVIMDDFNAIYAEYLETADATSQTRMSFFSPMLSSNSLLSTSYYTYQGFQMKSYQVYYKAVPSQWIETTKGKNTGNTIKTLFSIIITAATSVPTENPILKTLSLCSSGVSILEDLLEWSGLSSIEEVVPSTSDYTKTRVNYDRVMQYTMTNYGNPGSEDFQVQLITNKITIVNIQTDTLIINIGEGARVCTTPSGAVIKSPHFDNPWATAFKRGYNNPGYEDITYTVGGKTIKFPQTQNQDD